MLVAARSQVESSSTESDSEHPMRSTHTRYRPGALTAEKSRAHTSRPVRSPRPISPSALVSRLVATPSNTLVSSAVSTTWNDGGVVNDRSPSGAVRYACFATSPGRNPTWLACTAGLRDERSSIVNVDVSPRGDVSSYSVPMVSGSESVSAMR